MEKVCVDCGTTFNPQDGRQRACNPCRVQRGVAPGKMVGEEQSPSEEQPLSEEEARQARLKQKLGELLQYSQQKNANGGGVLVSAEERTNGNHSAEVEGVVEQVKGENATYKRLVQPETFLPADHEQIFPVHIEPISTTLPPRHAAKDELGPLVERANQKYNWLLGLAWDCFNAPEGKHKPRLEWLIEMMESFWDEFVDELEAVGRSA